MAQSCLTLCDPMDCSTPSFPVHHQLPEFVQTHIYWVSNVIQSSHHLLSPSPPAFNLSQNQGLSQWVSSLHQLAKYQRFSFNISPSNDYSGLISFRMDWLDLLAAILFSLVLYSTILFSFYILYSHQQCTSVPISPHLCQHTDLCVCVSVCVCVLNSHPNDSGDQS